MRTYVINLPESVDRRNHIEVQLQTAALDYTVIEAVNGRMLSAAERAALVDDEAVARFPDWLTPGAIGCALSHRVVYRRFLEDGGDAALVLEDDALLPLNAGALLGQLSAAVRPNEVALLNFRSFEAAKLSRADVVAVDGHSFVSPVQPRQLLGSLAYFVGRDAAEALAEAIVPVRVAADSWGHHAAHSPIELRCVLPQPIEHDVMLESTLGYSEVIGTSRADALRHLWPIRQLRKANRVRIKRNMSRVEFVD